MITFIISVLNGERGLQRCLDSIFSQTSSAWEIVIIDGESTDETVNIIKKNQSRLAYWVSEPDPGIYDAWNKALPHVKGDWFHFLGADDKLWDADVVATALPALIQIYPHSKIAYGQIYSAFADGRLNQKHGEPWDHIKARFWQEMCVPHQGVFHHRSLIDDGKTFDSSYRFAADYDLLLSEISNRPPVFLPNFIVAIWELGGATSTPRHALTIFQEMHRAQCRWNKAPDNWRSRYVKAWAKTMAWRYLGPTITTCLIDLGRRLTNRPALGRVDVQASH